MNNIEKKNWETPAVTKLSVKELTKGGTNKKKLEDNKGKSGSDS
ncbi:hypothetical protein [Aequorivita sinensis]|nr:hypothetical protein [Aequorivita sinensis]